MDVDLDRGRAEERAHRSEARLRATLDAALDAVVTMDHEGVVIDFNPAAERMFGYAAADVGGRDMAELIVPPALRERHRRGLARYLEGGAPVVLDQRIEITGMRSDATEFPVELTITRIDVPGPAMFTGYLRDITDRVKAEADLRASRARVVGAADEARRRIERDLHDGAQQRLVGLAIALRLARRRLPAEPEAAAALLDDAGAELAAATEELRELARGIHPTVLVQGGLEAAIPDLAARSAVPAHVAEGITERLPAAVESAAYFVVAEGLTNVARHAAATGAEVRLRSANGCLHVEVSDDGHGGAHLDGSGLRGLADRVAALDGRLEVHSPPGAGTRLLAEIPCGS